MTTLETITRAAVITGRSSIASKRELREAAAAAPASATISYTAKSAAVRAATKALTKDGIKEPKAGVHFLVTEHKAGARESFTWARLAMPAAADTAGGIAAEAKAPATPPAAPAKADDDMPDFLVRTPEAEAKIASARERRATELRAKLAEENAKPKPAKVEEAKPEKARKAKATGTPASQQAPTKREGASELEAAVAFVTAGSQRPRPDTVAATEAALKGTMPATPDISHPSHKSWWKRFEAIKTLVAAKDLAGLKADTLEQKSSTRVIICRYRNLAILALEAKGGKAKR